MVEPAFDRVDLKDDVVDSVFDRVDITNDKVESVFDRVDLTDDVVNFVNGGTHSVRICQVLPRLHQLHILIEFVEEGDPVRQISLWTHKLILD